MQFEDTKINIGFTTVRICINLYATITAVIVAASEANCNGAIIVLLVSGITTDLIKIMIKSSLSLSKCQIISMIILLFPIITIITLSISGDQTACNIESHISTIESYFDHVSKISRDISKELMTNGYYNRNCQVHIMYTMTTICYMLSTLLFLLLFPTHTNNFSWNSSTAEHSDGYQPKIRDILILIVVISVLFYGPTNCTHVSWGLDTDAKGANKDEYNNIYPVFYAFTMMVVVFCYTGLYVYLIRFLKGAVSPNPADLI